MQESHASWEQTTVTVFMKIFRNIKEWQAKHPSGHKTLKKHHFNVECPLGRNYARQVMHESSEQELSFLSSQSDVSAYKNSDGSRRISEGVQFNNITVFNYSKYLERHAWANSTDPDQMPQNMASEQGLPCLPLTQQFYTYSQVVNWTCWREVHKEKYPKFIKFIQNFQWKWNFESNHLWIRP